MITIKFNELLDFDQSPKRGRHDYYDSKVVEMEFEVDGIQHFIKAHIDIHYSRWIHPETSWCPKEDECDLVQYKAEAIKGSKIVKGDVVLLSDKELRKLLPRIEDEIIFE
jgi:hypothetical protein